MKRYPAMVVAFAFMLLATICGTKADVIYSNLASGDSYHDSYPLGGIVVSGPASVHRVATAFSTGPHEWSFERAELALGHRPAVEDDSFVMQLVSDKNGLPETVLQTTLFSGVSPSSSSLITVASGSPMILEANRTYWIVLSSESDLAHN